MDSPDHQYPIPVIVRGWADEPVRLWVHGSKNRGKTLIVGAETPTVRPIGLPHDVVYCFTPEAWTEIKHAFDAGDGTAVACIFGKLQHLQK